MTTLTERPHTALVVIDVQRGVVAAAHDRDRVVANIATLVERARAQQTPVVWVLHSHPEHLPRESDAWQLVPELAIADGEPVVHKAWADSFEETDLEGVLAGLGVGRLVVSGAQTDECIRSTLHGALVRGYDATLVSDAHTTEDQSGVRRTDARPGDRPHEPVLDLPLRPGPRAAGTVTTAEAFTSPAAAG